MITPPTVWTFRRVVWATLIFVFVAISFWLLFRFSQVLLIFFISLIVGTVIRPGSTWLYSHGVPRILGIILIYLLLFTLVIGSLLLLFPLIAEQTGTIVASFPDYYTSLRNLLLNSPSPLIARMGLFLPSTLPVLEPVQRTGQEALASAEQALGYIIMATNAIFITTVIFLLSFHWTLSGSRMIQSTALLFPTGQRERVRELVGAMETKLTAFIAGQGLLCLVIGIMALVAYLLIGLPNALVLAFTAGVLEAVPVIGPVLGAVPAAIIALSVDPSKLVWVIVASVVIQALENYILVPRVMRRAVGVNPFVSLLALFAFSSLLGVVGALIAIPIAAIVQLLLENFVFNTETSEPEPSFGRSYASRLRLEAQELIQDLRKQARRKRGGTDLRVREVDQLIDEIETITIDLESVLGQDRIEGVK